MDAKEAEQFWNNEQYEPHPVELPTRPSSPFPRGFPSSTHQERTFFVRTDGRLKKALDLLTSWCWAGHRVSHYQMSSVRSLAGLQASIYSSLARTLSEKLEENMVVSQRPVDMLGQKEEVYEACIVFLPPQAARYIADALEKQERRIAELEQLYLNRHISNLEKKEPS